jgi:hypothetical protein
MNQDTLRLRKTPPADSMEAAEIALSNIVKQALEKEMRPAESSFNNPLMTLEEIIRHAAANLGISMVHDSDLAADPEPEQIVPAELLNDSQFPALAPEELTTASDGTQAEEIRPSIPQSWMKGQLLNVRNRGEFYVVTLLGEEDEPPLKPAPNGALRFTNTALCQNFVSKWYATEHHDPRAR